MPRGTGPFPQSNDVNKIFQLIEYCKDEVSMKELQSLLGMSPRQCRYYADSAAYLGFIQRTKKGFFSLTEGGIKFLRTSRRNKKLYLIKRIADIDICRFYLNKVFLAGEKSISLQEVQKYLEEHYYLSPGVAKRRACTVKAWISWIQDVSSVKCG